MHRTERSKAPVLSTPRDSILQGRPLEFVDGEGHSIGDGRCCGEADEHANRIIDRLLIHDLRDLCAIEDHVRESSTFA